MTVLQSARSRFPNVVTLKKLIMLMHKMFNKSEALLSESDLVILMRLILPYITIYVADDVLNVQRTPTAC